MLISELIVKLEKIKDKYGDNQIHLQTTDWEGGTYYTKTEGVEVVRDGDGVRIELHDGIWDYTRDIDWIHINGDKSKQE